MQRVNYEKPPGAMPGSGPAFAGAARREASPSPAISTSAPSPRERTSPPNRPLDRNGAILRLVLPRRVRIEEKPVFTVTVRDEAGADRAELQAVARALSPDGSLLHQNGRHLSPEGSLLSSDGSHLSPDGATCTRMGAS